MPRGLEEIDQKESQELFTTHDVSADCWEVLLVRVQCIYRKGGQAHTVPAQNVAKLGVTDRGLGKASAIFQEKSLAKLVRLCESDTDRGLASRFSPRLSSAASETAIVESWS